MSDDQSAIISASQHEITVNTPNLVTIKNVRGV